jgi:hypothetical protein
MLAMTRKQQTIRSTTSYPDIQSLGTGTKSRTTNHTMIPATKSLPRTLRAARRFHWIVPPLTDLRRTMARSMGNLVTAATLIPSIVNTASWMMRRAVEHAIDSSDASKHCMAATEGSIRTSHLFPGYLKEFRKDSGLGRFHEVCVRGCDGWRKRGSDTK